MYDVFFVVWVWLFWCGVWNWFEYSLCFYLVEIGVFEGWFKVIMIFGIWCDCDVVYYFVIIFVYVFFRDMMML